MTSSDVTDVDWRRQRQSDQQQDKAAESTITSWQLSSAEYGRDPVPLVRKKTEPPHILKTS